MNPLSFVENLFSTVGNVFARIGSLYSKGAEGAKSPWLRRIAVTLLLLVLSAATTEVIGIHALFGAFLFGAVLPKDGHLAETMAERIETVAVGMLLPLFFAFSGLRTQIGLVSQPSEWLVTAAIIGVATLGKFGGSSVAARLTGLKWREASAVGILMNTRGLMELIVLNLGYELGLLGDRLFAVLVVMALVTTAMTGPLLGWSAHAQRKPD